MVFFEGRKDADDEVFGDGVDVGEVLLGLAEREDGALKHGVGVVEGVGVLDEGVLGGGDGCVSERDALAEGGNSERDDAFGEVV